MKMQEMLQLRDTELSWIGISAQAIVLAPTKRATVTMIASASKIMCAEKTTASISGMMRNLLLIVVFQVFSVGPRLQYLRS